MEDEPIFLRVYFDGEINLPITEIGGGGARVLCYKCRGFFDDFYIGQALGKSILVLREGKTHEIKPIIRWKGWPCVGVQFIDLTDKARADIFQFLFKLERRKLKRMNGTETRVPAK